MFFKISDKFADNIAVYDMHLDETITYSALAQKAKARASEYGTGRKLIFITAKNDIRTVIDYVAALDNEHVVYLLENSEGDKAKALIKLYNPNIVINGDGEITHHNTDDIPLHSDLALLLSTSGSTGTPKFVKLSAQNIQSNAQSISDYLEITEEDRAICHLKLHYSYGISILNSHLNVGAAVILTQDNIISDEFWAQVKKYEATSFAGVPHNYESLLHNNFKISDYPSIKYATQAGGKLSAQLVQKMAESFNAQNARFVVMYGQTEAAPRISYLPSDMAEKYPGTIGKAIPGGTLSLIDTKGAPITTADTEGELCYKGPNVMMGYAECVEDLSSDETPEFLKTGDIACINSDGLYYITGRTKRFIKPFGLRINLDDIQTKVKETYSVSAVTGTDSEIIVIVSGTDERSFNALQQELAKTYKLPEAMFSIGYYEEIPLMPTGKYDYKKILEQGAVIPEKPGFFKRITNTILDVLEINDRNWNSILDLYRDVLERDSIEYTDCFDDLNADSLSFVNLSLALEEVLGPDMPASWRKNTIEELDAILYRTRT